MKCKECYSEAEVVQNDGGGFIEYLLVCDDCGEIEVLI